MREDNNEAGPFENLLTFCGTLTGAIQGYEHSELMGLIIGTIFLGAIGKWVGAIADWFLQLIVLIAFLMFHATIRQFAWELIHSVFTA